MASTVNFLSYNSMGLNSIKADWIRNLYKVTNCDFIFLQEHFKKTNATDKFFKDQFPDHVSYIVKGHRDSCQDSGRPKGGIAQLCSKHIDCKVDRVVTKNYRIQAHILDFPNIRILWLITYFPTDPGGELFEEDELSDLLKDIETILDTSVILSEDIKPIVYTFPKRIWALAT